MADEAVEVEGAEDQRLSPWQEMQNKINAESTKSQDFADSVREAAAHRQAEEARRIAELPENQYTVAGEVGRAVWGVGVDLGVEATVLVNQIQETILPVRQLYGGASSALRGDGWSQGVFDAQAQFQADKEALRAAGDRIAPENKSFVGGAARGMGTFLVPYVGWLKGAKAAQLTTAGGFTEATIVGAFIDGGLFDPNDGNLSNLIQEMNPELQDEVWLFLATDPDDSEALNRFRNALEGGVLGTALEGIFKMARFGIAANKVRKANNAADASPDQMLKPEEIEKLRAVDANPFDDLKTDIDGNSRLITAGDEVGKLELVERGGTNLQVINAEVVPEFLAQGNGKKLYAEAARQADEANLTLTSDTSVSADAARVWESMARNGEEITDLRKTNPELVDVDVEDGITRYRASRPIFERKPKAVTVEEGAQTQGIPVEGAAKSETSNGFFHEESIRNTLSLDAGQRKALNDALLSGDDKAASQILELNDFNIDTIDWDKVEGPEDIKRLMNTVSEVTADHIDEVKGGVQTHEQTKRLANLVGATGDHVHSLFKDIRGDKGISARFLAAKRTMMMAARKAQELIEISKAAPGDQAKRSAVMRHLQLYSAIQAEVKGAQTEIARALNSMKILTDDAGNGFKEFDEIMRQFGGRGAGEKNFERYMDSLLEALQRGDIDGFNRGVRMTAGERTKNIIIEYVINAMLSSPATHKINFLSNMLNTFLYSTDRFLGGAYRAARYGDRAALREARLDLVDKFTRMDEAWRLAKQAWHDGAPVTDKRQRLEFQTRQAISLEGTARAATDADSNLKELGSPFFARKAEAVRGADGEVAAVVEFNWLQRAVNTLGRFVRVPGRGLITGDEFFKAINRNAEQTVLTFRQADTDAVREGLEYGTDAYEKFVKQRIKQLMNPRNEEHAARQIMEDSIHKSRKAAFQESPTTNGGRLLERAINSNRFVKMVIAPFFRTPMNILRQGTVDRMPWGRYLKGETRDIIMEGHPRARAEAIARTWTGMSAMAMSYMMIDSTSGPDGWFEIRGKTAFDSSIKDTQVKDYSVRLGDTWHQFNRLDPMGLWLGMVADLHHASKVAEAEDEPLIEAMGQAALGTFMANVVNKTWMKSLSDLLDFGESVSKRGISDEAAQRAWARMAGGQLGKFIPQIIKTSGKNIEAQIDGDERYAREAWTAFDNIRSQLPVFNKDLPKRYDNLGRPKQYPTQGLSPLQKSPRVESPIDKELERLDFVSQPMPKSLVGGSLPLTAEEYSELNRLVGTVELGNGTLEETLNARIQESDWEGLTDARKIYEIKLRIRAARAAARGLMLKNEEFREKYKEAVKEDPLALLQE